jgi:hypothetical protein
MYYAFLILVLLALYAFVNRRSYYRLTNDTDMMHSPGVRSVGMINSGMTSI